MKRSLLFFSMPRVWDEIILTDDEREMLNVDWCCEKRTIGEMEYGGMILWIRMKWKSSSAVVIHLARAELKWVKALITWLNPHRVLANRHACSVLTSVSLANNPQQSSCKLNYSRLIKWSLNCEWGEIKSCSHSAGIALFCSFAMEKTWLSQICRMDGIDSRPLQSTCWSVLRQDTSVVVYTTRPRPSHDQDQSVLRPRQDQDFDQPKSMGGWDTHLQ